MIQGRIRAVRFEQALVRALLDDFAGTEGEKIRLQLRNSGRYGAEGSAGERWALRIKDEFTALVRRESEPELRRCFIPGFFSWANTIGFGRSVGATPDGRRAGTPISHGANPTPGFVADGASLSLATVIARIQPRYGNTAPMQWDLDPSFAHEENAELIGSII